MQRRFGAPLRACGGLARLAPAPYLEREASTRAGA